MKKSEFVTYKCSSCGYSFKIKYNGWYPTTKCKKCNKTAKYVDLEGGGTFVRRYKDVTALVLDKKTGEPLWLDKKGNKLKYDSPEVRYDLQNDPYGWRKTGRKVRPTDKYGRPINWR